MNSKLILILGMFLVTYIPRLVPFYMISSKPLPKKVKQLLEFIPYAALGALIFPGVLQAIPENLTAVAMAMIFAIIAGWRFGGIVVPVLGSVVVAIVLLTL